MTLAVLVAYAAVLLLLSLQGLHRWDLLRLYRRHRSDPIAVPPRPDPLPVLTVQLPIYDERYVAARLLEAVGRLDWPADRLEIQVLDDSDDDTGAVVDRAAADLRARGLDVPVIRRGSRDGYKAGALAHGLAHARGELVLILDADFVPPPDLARRLVPAFADPRVGMVQARWGHLNAGASALTRVQSVLLDGHFVVEHAARHRSGLFFNFNGTAGIWRRRCIEDAGGWQGDTLTEDLDLSYRAQLRGWRFVYRPDVVVPAELPEEVAAFKSQQRRWAKGSVETLRKLLPSVVQAPLPLRVRLEALAHLGAGLCWPLTLLLALLFVPAVWARGAAADAWLRALDLPVFALATASFATFYRTAHGSWRWVVPALAVGVGLSVGNARAVLSALAGRRSPFQRTPKYALGPGENPASRRYRVPAGAETAVEAALGLWFLAGTASAVARGLWAPVPFLLLFAAGFGGVAALTLRESRARARAAGTPTTGSPAPPSRPAEPALPAR